MLKPIADPLRQDTSLIPSVQSHSPEVSTSPLSAGPNIVSLTRLFELVSSYTDLRSSLSSETNDTDVDLLDVLYIHLALGV